MPSRLTATSFIVLGFVEISGEATPYELKQRLELSPGSPWPVPHSQVYAETERLAGSGHLSERREAAGRRRRVYSLTDRGAAALELWRRTRSRELPQLRDPGLLQIFFGAEARRVAPARLELHRRKLAAYEQLADADDGGEPRGPWLALRAGILHERASITFWSELASEQA